VQCHQGRLDYVHRHLISLHIRSRTPLDRSEDTSRYATPREDPLSQNADQLPDHQVLQMQDSIMNGTFTYL
jgi:hypothetical protein